jgi:asparagine synthase (glutamine-hydrolysing)
VLLEAIAAWGAAAAFRACVGMFAIAVYDRRAQSLTLARDALGIKPMYYGWCGRRFVFASELGALDALPWADRDVSRDSLATFLRLSHVPAPHTIYANVRKLVPGTAVTLSTAAPTLGDLPEPWTFWSARDAALASPSTQSRDALEAEALERLRAAVSSQMVADVPVGAFLSGGIDSSLVVSVMQECSSRPVKTFTIGFDIAAFNEAESARRVAAHLGTEHTELVMAERELLEAMTELPRLCDEPFGDSSILPTYLVSRLAREHVTVCLSGDGGDELGWGYTRYALCEKAWARLERVPGRLRRAAAAVIGAKPMLALARRLPPVRVGGRTRHLGSRLQRIADVLGYREQADVYRDFMSHWKAPNAIVRDGCEHASIYGRADDWTTQLPMWRRMAVQDLLAYLPDDILTKVDRASMRVSLESRVPLLDHRFVEFCLRLPEAELHGGEPKRFLKRLLERYVPRELTERPKQGFGVPMADWLRGPLRGWASDLLAADRLRADGFFQAREIGEKLRQHLAGEADWAAWLWDVLCFQNWYDARRRAT